MKSEVRVLVYRGGVMASLGHNHVIASKYLSGKIYVHDELSKTGFELTIPVNSLMVDDPDLRKQEGVDFSKDIPTETIAGTRRNMLGGKVLDGKHYPVIDTPG